MMTEGGETVEGITPDAGTPDLSSHYTQPRATPEPWIPRPQSEATQDDSSK